MVRKNEKVYKRNSDFKAFTTIFNCGSIKGSLTKHNFN